MPQNCNTFLAKRLDCIFNLIYDISDKNLYERGTILKTTAPLTELNEFP